MTNTLTFTTTMDTDTLNPIEYAVEGTLWIDGEETPIGFSSADFDRVFDELRHWTKTIESVDVTFKTKEYIHA